MKDKLTISIRLITLAVICNVLVFELALNHEISKALVEFQTGMNFSLRNVNFPANTKHWVLIPTYDDLLCQRIWDMSDCIFMASRDRRFLGNFFDLNFISKIFERKSKVLKVFLNMSSVRR